MFSPEEMAKDQLTLLPTGKFINVNSVNTSLSEIYEHIIPLIYIGSRDHNGRRIFDGDILDQSMFPDESGPYKIVFCRGCFCRHYTGQEEPIPVGISRSFELLHDVVIGNIYEDFHLLEENPELLDK